MPRISRKNIIGKCFHLMSQGINKEKIFLDNMWKEKYKELLKKYSLEYKINIISYCIMNNHVHLLVYVDDVNNLSKFMHRINTIYASYYNRENNRVGYVFRNRYQVQTIKDEMHLKTCIVYIHNNPPIFNILFQDSWLMQFLSYLLMFVPSQEYHGFH